jgi:hypothetical protein
MKRWIYLLALLILLEAISATVYLSSANQPGFPLDDAWIHQIYARNLGLHGVLAFNPGQPSTGSTSFGWTLLLAAGYWLKVPFFLWTYLWGSIFAVATASVAAKLSENYFGSFRNAIIVGVICLLEWHLAWAAVSGMEIGLFTFLTLLFFLLLNRNLSPILLGTLTGITVLVRPEGILLALVYGIKLLLNQPRNTKQILRDGAKFLLVFVIIISPWIAFNLIYSHRPFPNTIAAKFMQYGYPWSLWKSLKYLWDVFLYFLNGSLLLLIPGVGFVIYNALKRGETHLLYPYIWFLTLIGLYAVALPAIYDQGRYLMPLIPLLVIYGVEGLSQLLNGFIHTPLLRSLAWVSLFGLVFVLWINGASDYAYRIQLYNAVHIKAAQWISANTPQNAVIATHDIGIIGYHTERQIVDLAGLVTPQIVPIMRDPQKLADYLRKQHVSYLILYTGYYRELLKALNAHLVYSPAAAQLKAMGVEPFEVYEISQ